MKKIACLLACCLLPLGTATAFAKEAAVRVPEGQISLTETQTAFEAVIEAEPDNAYAGVEIGVACPEGVAVTASAGSSGSMSAGPVLASGLYWTSFFESDNQLSGTMKITLQFSCSEAFETGDILLETVKVLTKDGASVVTEELAPSLRISVVRSGSDPTGSAPTSSDPTGSAPTNSDPTASTSAGTTGTDETKPTGNGPHGSEDSIPATGNDGRLSAGMTIFLVSGCVVLGMMSLFVIRKKVS